MTPLAAHLRARSVQARSAALEARHGGPRPANARPSAAALAAVGIAAALYAAGLVALDITPARLWAGFGRLFDITALMLPPVPTAWSRIPLYLDALGQTLSIALLGTLAASLLAFPFGFLAAKTVVADRALHVLARRGLDTVRSIDTLIWALIWINVVGLGPFAGALAIASADFAALAKLMSEAVETSNRRPRDAVLACGGGPVSAVRFGVLPQVLPVFASQVLYVFESNVRSATIIGIVGAGGIGLHLYEQIRTLEWQEAAFIILMVLVTVAMIDALSRRLRGALIGAGRR